MHAPNRKALFSTWTQHAVSEHWHCQMAQLTSHRGTAPQHSKATLKRFISRIATCALCPCRRSWPSSKPGRGCTVGAGHPGLHEPQHNLKPCMSSASLSLHCTMAGALPMFFWLAMQRGEGVPWGPQTSKYSNN